MDAQEQLSFEGWAKLPSFQKKVEQAKEIIREALAIAPAYVAVSWGKDSTVLLHLCQQVDPNIPAIFWTDPEQENFGNYSEVIKQYIGRFSPNYTEIEIVGDRVPHKVEASRIWEQYPMAIIGLRKEEGGGRVHTFKHGLIHQYKSGDHIFSWRSLPLGYWSWKDVWAYIVNYDLPYLNTYENPIAGGYAHSRTCNLLAKQPGNTKGVHNGRIAALRMYNPDYYNYLRTHYPNIASAT